MERKNFIEPKKISSTQEDEYDYDVYLDTHANALLLSKKLKGDPFSCIFGCTPKNIAMKKFFTNQNLYKRIVLPNLSNMVIDPSAMPIGKSDILLPWTDLSAPHLIVEPASFLPHKQKDVATYSEATGETIKTSAFAASINFIAPKDVVMLYFESVMVDDEIVSRPTLILTSREHAMTMVSMSGERPEMVNEVYIEGVSIRLDKTKVLEPVENGGVNEFKIVDYEPILEDNHIIQTLGTEYYS